MSVAERSQEVSEDSRRFYFNPIWTSDSISYAEAKPFPHIVIDDFLPTKVLDRVLDEFLPFHIRWGIYRHADSNKLGCSHEECMGENTRHLLAQFNGATFMLFLEKLTGISGLIPDPHLFGGGLHMYERGGFLGIHADFNIHEHLRLDRRLNLLLYLNKDWKEEWGGCLDLWNRDMTRCERSILPIFNRCVIFNTTDFSFHGLPKPLTCPEEVTRKSIAMYYYSVGRPAEEKSQSHSTMYQKVLGEK